MLLITPTDWGTCADIAGVAEVCHEFDVPLIVDEAWGAHLPFHPDLPTWGMDAGADLVVTSVHKMGGAIEQSSVFHLQGDRVDPDGAQAARGPAGHDELLGAGLPDPRRLAPADGRAGRGAARRGARAGGAGRERDRRDDGLRLMGREVVGPAAPSTSTRWCSPSTSAGSGISGYQAAEWLRAERHVDIGSADTCRISARLTHADDDETERPARRRAAALVEDADARSATAVDLPAPRGWSWRR
jgi:arginine decarboxylase